jgi:hypothetical protein
MSLITDAQWTLQQLRIHFLRSEDPLAERLVSFNGQQSQIEQALGEVSGSQLNLGSNAQLVMSGTPQMQSKDALAVAEQNSQYMYVQDAFPERTLCYSPNLQHVMSELTKNNRMKSNLKTELKGSQNIKRSTEDMYANLIATGYSYIVGVSKRRACLAIRSVRCHR